MWSRWYAGRARRERERVLEKSRQLVASPGAHARATHYGAARFVKGATLGRGTGEVLAEAGAKPGIDQAAIDAAAELDGCCLAIASETDWGESRTLDARRGLWRIEESPRVTKTGGLGPRPAWARAEGHARARSLTCCLALLIVRPSQRALPPHPSAEALLSDARARLPLRRRRLVAPRPVKALASQAGVNPNTFYYH